MKSSCLPEARIIDYFQDPIQINLSHLHFTEEGTGSEETFVYL